jgi:DNA replication and repair protein RecF
MGVKMQLLDLKLLNFRNYEKLELQFNPYKNIIIGKNGMGKTNIVEAIYVLALTKSFRGSKEDVIIKNNCDLTRVEGNVLNKYTDNYKVIIKASEKKVKINNNKVDKISDYISRINIVLFTSEDLKLIKDTPNTRRKLINIELSQFSNDYLKILTYYNKVLKQRNSYLKTLYLNGNASKDYLDILTNQLIEIGIKVNKYRLDFTNNISKYISENYYKITGHEGLELKYKSDFNDKDKDSIINMYKKEIDRDIVLGKTNIGIHRDDYEFFLDGRNLKDYGSEGEQKNAIIALKLAEINIFKEDKHESPILILDDLFSELDQQKINNILKFISDDIQTFITTTDVKKVSKKLMENSKIFKVNNGEIEEELYEK